MHLERGEEISSLLMGNVVIHVQSNNPHSGVPSVDKRGGRTGRQGYFRDLIP